MRKESFEDCIGKTFKFYGVDSNCFKIGPNLFEAVEDPDDGYRSYLGTVEPRTDDYLIFFKRSIATVKLIYTDEYRLEDIEDGHVWLRFGTDTSCHYYPMFYFTYTPKAPK